MILHLRELVSKGHVVTIQEHLDMQSVLEDCPEFRLAQAAEVNITASHQTGTVWVTGTMTAPLFLQCSKCLKHFEQTMQFSVKEGFTQDTVIARKDEELHLIAEDHINFVPYLRDILIVNLPLASVCHEDCRGLCAECGIDRNLMKCECVQQLINPRMDALKNFFET
jgi:uncharacterized protein